MNSEEDAKDPTSGGNENRAEESFRTGNWVGCWEQAGYEFPTALHLEFRNDGMLYGVGADAAGHFTMGGEYDPQSGVVRIKKLYGVAFELI